MDDQAGCARSLTEATTWSPEQAGWPYSSPIAREKYRPHLQEEIDAAGMAKDCVKLEKLFQEVADLPDADELLTYSLIDSCS
jgi:hypothetical protein